MVIHNGIKIQNPAVTILVPNFKETGFYLSKLKPVLQVLDAVSQEKAISVDYQFFTAE